MTYIPRSSNGKIGTSSSIPRVVKKKRTFRIFSFLGTTMVIVAVLGTVGVLFFKNLSEGQLDEAQISLTAASEVVGDSKARIDEIRKYDEKLKNAALLLDNHLAPSLLFNSLELNTKETIQYKTFEYNYDPGFEALLTLGGSTEEFTSIVLQKMQLDSIDSPFEVAIVNDITKEQGENSDEDDSESTYEDGEVIFSVTGLLKESRFLYSGDGIEMENDPEVEEETEDSEAQEDSPNESDEANE